MKRLKRVLATLFIVVLTGGTLAFVFRQALFITVLGIFLKPSVPFDAAKAPPAPDYADPASWAALPDKDDASDWMPPGYTEPENPLRDQIDVFYIHPTGFFGTNNWNAAMGEDSQPGIPTEAMLASQASAFNGVGRVYAPEYRQATLYSFIEGEKAPEQKNGKLALELAYVDVARAFDYFLEHYNQGRPFILASHSQGTCHALRLVAEKIDDTAVRHRMVAAYLVGFGVPKDYFETVYKNVKPGTTPTQTGCVLTWDTLCEGVTPSIGGFHYYPGGWQQAKGKPRFCVNPLTWSDAPGPADAALNHGALVTDMGGLGKQKLSPAMLQKVNPAQTGAEVRGGALFVRDLSGTPFVTVMSTGGNYHLFDYHLFWVNIRENALARVQEFLKNNPVSVVQNPASPA